MRNEIKNVLIIQIKLDKPNSDPYFTKPGEKPYKLEIVWRNVLLFIVLHGMAAYGFYIPAEAGTWWISKLIKILIKNPNSNFFISCRLGFDRFMGYRSWRSSLLVSQVLQSQQKDESDAFVLPNHRLAKQRHRVGQRPSSASQIQRHQRRSAQH